jgi:hypothetical protein
MFGLVLTSASKSSYEEDYKATKNFDKKQKTETLFVEDSCKSENYPCFNYPELVQQRGEGYIEPLEQIRIPPCRAPKKICSLCEEQPLQIRSVGDIEILKQTKGSGDLRVPEQTKVNC